SIDGWACSGPPRTHEGFTRQSKIDGSLACVAQAKLPAGLGGFLGVFAALRHFVWGEQSLYRFGSAERLSLGHCILQRYSKQKEAFFGGMPMLTTRVSVLTLAVMSVLTLTALWCQAESLGEKKGERKALEVHPAPHLVEKA